MAMPPPPLPGDRVGAYTLVRPLGVGGMAAVYEAVGARGERVAVKILHADQLGTDDVRRFKREILALGSLNHPGVVRVLDAGRQGVYPWMAMEFVDGTDLGEEIQRWRTQPPPDRFQRVEAILRGLCDALGTVHSRGIIHRDIKPSNVLITRDGRVKLTDFGVARSETGMTLPGEQRPVGTLAFMAPEQIRGGPADPRSDLYALGALLYQLLTGAQPFVSTTVAGYVDQHLRARPRPPSELDPRVPARLEAICLRLLLKDPAQRYASARQVIQALEQGEARAAAPVRGREAELDALLSRMRRLARGQGGMVVVTGPSGSGRSALLSELARRARAEGQDVAMCSSEEPDPIATLCDQLPELGDSLRLHPDAASRLVHRARGRPWALLVDDLDRMGPGALEALNTLARDRVAIEGEPLLLVVTVSAPTGLAEELCAGVSTGLSPDRVVLGPLDEIAAAEVAQDHGLMGMAGHTLGRRLVALGVAQPGAIIERLEGLERAGLLVQMDRGGLVPARGMEELLDHAGPVTAPLDLSVLGEAAVAAGQTLAAFDGEAEEGVLLEAIGAGATEGLEALQAAGLATRDPERDDRDALLRFPDPLVTAAVASSMSPGRGREVHARVAEVLRARSRRESRWLPQLADHLQRSGQIAAAWPLLVEAAHRALRLRQTEVAWRWLRRAMETRGVGEPALDAHTRQNTRVHLYAVEGALWALQQAWERAAEAWQQGVESAEQAGDAEAARRSRVGLSQALLGMGQFGPALQASEGALLGLVRGDPSWPRAVALRAVLQLAQGDAQAAAEGWRALAEFGAEVHQAATLGNASAWLAEIAALEGRWPEVEAEAGAALAKGSLPEPDRVRLLAAAVCAAHAEGRREDLERAANEATRLVHAGVSRREPMVGAAALSLCRALIDAGLLEQASRSLPPEGLLSTDPLDAPRTQRAALHARLLAHTAPDEGAIRARRARLLPLPRLPWLAALCALDLAEALRPSSPEEARAALEPARATLPARGLDALRRRMHPFSEGSA